MKIKETAHNVLGNVLGLLLLIMCFSVSYFLTSLIYNNIGLSPSPFMIQLINSLLGIILALIIIKIGLHFDKQKTAIFDSIIQAQKRISGGNFDVSMDMKSQELGPFGQLMKSVNDMALGLSKMEKMRQEFISNVSHEIQSPLTSIRGYARALRSKLSAEDRLHYLNIIENESMRLSRLSDNLLKLASLEAETMKPDPESYRLDKQLRSIILSCQPQWSKKKINMDLSLEKIKIKADEDMMSQVWINLINNSIKFTPENGSIKINLQQHDEIIEFRISDTGRGIAEEEQDKIFERFYKIDKARSPSIEGSGLGLSIAKRIIEMHNGSIKVESVLGAGTTFTVNLPG